VRGLHRDHVLAFARSAGEEALIVVVGRHFAPLTDGGRHWPQASRWDAALVLDGFASTRDALIPARKLDDGSVRVAALFDPVPVAVLRATRLP
jgi:(1->4)-alpha-D-glucan 1-alpha-D-glucosylmutase